MDKTVQEAVALGQLSAAGGPVDVYACVRCIHAQTRENERREWLCIYKSCFCVRTSNVNF